VFGETLVFERLLAESGSDRGAARTARRRIDDSIATVFRQMAMNRFEHLVHTRRRSQGELSHQEHLAGLVESQREMLGDSVEITEGLPLVVVLCDALHQHAGLRLCLRLWATARAVGVWPLPRGRRVVRAPLLEMLAAGGSRAPEKLGQIVRIELADPGFWDAGLKLIDRQLSRRRSARRPGPRSGKGRGSRSASWPRAAVLLRSSCASTTFTISFRY